MSVRRDFAVLSSETSRLRRLLVLSRISWPPQRSPGWSTIFETSTAWSLRSSPFKWSVPSVPFSVLSARVSDIGPHTRVRRRDHCADELWVLGGCSRYRRAVVTSDDPMGLGRQEFTQVGPPRSGVASMPAFVKISPGRVRGLSRPGHLNAADAPHPGPSGTSEESAF